MTSPAVRRLADRITTTAKRPQQQRFLRGTVASVTANGAADGSTAISVTVGGSTIPTPYLAGTTYSVGDTVLLLLIDSSPILLGRITGPPSI